MRNVEIPSWEVLKIRVEIFPSSTMLENKNHGETSPSDKPNFHRSHVASKTIVRPAKQKPWDAVSIVVRPRKREIAGQYLAGREIPVPDGCDVILIAAGSSSRSNEI